jgi:hypothetical protein
MEMEYYMDESEANKALQEVHKGIWATNTNEHIMTIQI